MIESSLLDELSTFSAPSILNGLKALGVEVGQLQSMRRQDVKCVSPGLGARIGFAVTRRVTTRRHGGPSARTRQGEVSDSNADVIRQPAPRILVVENVGDHMGPMCIWGELAAHINLALGCVGGITNGPVRDLSEMEAAGFQTFAGGVDVGGGHVETLEVGVPVTVGGMTVHPGDLLFGDLHGVVKVPIDLAGMLAAAIRAHAEHERQIIELCRSDRFSLDELAELMSAR